MVVWSPSEQALSIVHAVHRVDNDKLLKRFEGIRSHENDEVSDVKAAT